MAQGKGETPRVSKKKSGKNRNPHRKKRKSPPVPEVDPGVMAAYYDDPIALLQDGEYEALEEWHARF